MYLGHVTKAQDSIHRDDRAGCTCWMIPDEGGIVHPLAWALLHEDLRVVPLDGGPVEGWAVGAYWFGPMTRPTPRLEITPENGWDISFARDQIRTLSPMHRQEDPSEILQGVKQALRAPEGIPEEEGLCFRLVISDHQAVSVTIERLVIPCRPPSRPPWQGQG